MVLPGKRGALFLRRHLAASFGTATWLPRIISTEDLIESLTGLNIPDEPELVCELFEAYLECLGDEAEPFESFAKWGQLMLHDFNEIDRYLADSVQLYENLRDIKEIENWSLGASELTLQQQRYIDFMGNIGKVYRIFRRRMLSRQLAWPGLAYRIAAEESDIAAYCAGFHKVLFCGFNALSKSEIAIISHMHKAGAAELIWDADHYYLDDTEQEAGAFLRNNFRLFPSRDHKFTGRYFEKKKSVRIVSVPKQMGQAQVVRQALEELHAKGVPFDQVAVVLANEKLLWPVLLTLPREVEHLNVTMEYPLRYTGAYDLVESVIQIQYSFAKQNRGSRTVYHKDLARLLRQPLFRRYFALSGSKKPSGHYIDQLTYRNLAFLDDKLVHDLFAEDAPFVLQLISEQDAPGLCATLRNMVALLMEGMDPQKGGGLEYEHLATLMRMLNRMSEVMTRYRHFNSIVAFRQLFVQVAGEATCPFLGEPLSGLQVMGVLETRTLDFPHVILVNVNEGVLPSGRTINSFIPNDLKRLAGLPLYTEKDAVYAYHFYRLLQRAESVTITYDSETDTFGKGERSRFLTQLLVEMRRFSPETEITEQVAANPTLPVEDHPQLSVQKDPVILSAIAAKALGNGEYDALSPSGLLTFKQCSLRFYLRYGVKLKETEEVEETPEAGTFGSILHRSLEDLYKPVAGSPLTVAGLRSRLTDLDQVSESSFLEITGRTGITGKSLLQLEAIKVYVKKLVQQDIASLQELGQENRQLQILFLEHELSASLDIPGLPGPVFVRGKIDRIDMSSGRIRIIDYKSSLKPSDKFTFTGFQTLFHDPGSDKLLQLLIYAWLVWKNRVAEARQITACIIPFRVFGEKPRFVMAGSNQALVFTDGFLTEFEDELKKFIASIFNLDLPFSQTEDRRICEFCAYNVICNFHP